MTNADMIWNTVDVGKLAEILSVVACRTNISMTDCGKIGNCKSCWIKWLKQEIKK